MFFIAEDRCLHLRKAWDGYAYKENGDTDKSSGLDHISDAAAYLICRTSCTDLDLD